MRQVLAELEHLRRKTRAMLFVQRGAVLLAWTLGAIVVLLLLDYSLRLPSAFRLLMLIAGLALLFVGVLRYVLAVLDYRPSLTQLALRVERAMPSVRGRLASGVEFAMSGLDEENPLAARSVREAQRRLSGESVNAIVRSGRLARDLGALGVVVAVATVLVAVSPATAQTGLLRLFAPYGSAEWPARTAVGSLMSDVLEREGVHPRGQALALRARNRTGDDPAGRVDAHYRTMEDGAFGPWRQVVLTHQGDGVHERLVDTNAEAIEVYFATEDARTKPERIRLVTPPAVDRATLVVTPPAYAEGRLGTYTGDLGPGLDDRAVTESPSLVGSRASLVLELNKPLPVVESDDRDAWIARTFGWDAAGDELPELTVLPGDDDAPMRWQLDWTLRETRTLALELRDEYGLGNRDPISYRIEVRPDTPPSVTITEPQSDIAVARTARVPLVGEAKDDVAVVGVGLRAQVLRPDGASEELPFAPQREADAATAGIEADLDLRDLPLSEGDVVLVTAVADDGFQLDGARHDTATSSARRLRIVSELDLSAQLRRQLSAVRQNAIRMESQQAELQQDVIESGPQPGLEEAQAQIADRVATQRDVIEELEAQVDRNRLDDAQLESLLQQSRDLLDYAGRAANKAVEAIEAGEEQDRQNEGREGDPGEKQPNEDRRTPEERDADEPAEEDRAVVDAQQEVRDELADLIELLDRDEDTWMVQRQLQGLIEGQQRLSEETAQLAQETIGQSLDDLTPAQLSEIDRIAQRQRDLRDKLRGLIEEMRRRAEALEEIDPQAASGMRTAADTGEQREVDRDMENAAGRAEQNQLQSAGAAQQAAMTSLNRMQADLEETKRARAEELLRQLASLLESIERLIVGQENELMALAQATERDDFTGRDRAAIRLSQNTRSVAAEARAAGQEARRVARALDRAADAQDAAVVALRADPRDAAAAHTAEERALAQLKEAKELAEALEQRTEEEQVQKAREELIAAYRALAEKQVVVRGETIELAGSEELTRRELVEARRLGNVQQEIRTGASDLEAQTQEILQSEVFHFVHGLIDDWSGAVSDALWEGKADVDVTDRQQMIADSIARQIEAIEESQTPPEEFAEQPENAPGSGGGGGAPAPLIPPVAEVKRLHGLQEQVYEQTRSIDGRDDLEPGQRRQRVRELGRMQNELKRLGEGLLEKMQSGAGPGTLRPATPPPPPPEEPGDGQPEPPDDSGQPEGSTP